MSRSQMARAARLSSACQFIESNLHRDDLSPALTAAALNISVRQLHMLFEPTGKSFSRYVLDRRLESACGRLLENPQARIIDVALASGIRSSTVFYRAFRDAFGMNPTQYRQISCTGAVTPESRLGAEKA